MLFSLAVNTFATEADKAQMDLTADNEESRHLQTQLKKWDRKKKKMVTIERVCTLTYIISCYEIWIYFLHCINRIQRRKKYAPNRVYGYLLHIRQIVTMCGRRRVRSMKMTAKMIVRKNLRKRKIVSQHNHISYKILRISFKSN